MTSYFPEVQITQREKKKELHAIALKASWDIGTGMKMSLSYKINILIFRMLSF